MGFNRVCKSGQNNAKQFTTLQKLLHCLGVQGVGIFIIASVLDLNGITIMFFCEITNSFPMYTRFVLLLCCVLADHPQ